MPKKLLKAEFKLRLEGNEVGKMENNKMVTLSELVRKGWSKELLMRIAHMPASPMFRTNPRGKFYVIEEKLREFVSQRRVGK